MDIETSSKSTISCVFLNQSDTSNKTCCITHILCGQTAGPTTVQECNNIFPYRIEVNVSGRSKQTYCYVVTASNDTYTVIVNGSFIPGIIYLYCFYATTHTLLYPAAGFEHGGISTVIIIATSVAGAILFILLVLFSIIGLIFWWKKKG